VKYDATLNAMIRGFLEIIVEQGKYDSGLKRFLLLSENYSGNYKDWKWGRDDIYEI